MEYKYSTRRSPLSLSHSWLREITESIIVLEIRYLYLVPCSSFTRIHLRCEPCHQGDKTPQPWNPGARDFFFWGCSFIPEIIFFLLLFLSFYLSSRLSFLCTHSLGTFEFNQFHQSKVWRINKKRSCVHVIGPYTCLNTQQTKVSMSNNNPHLNFGFHFGLINGLIDDKVYVPQ